MKKLTTFILSAVLILNCFLPISYADTEDVSLSEFYSSFREMVNNFVGTGISSGERRDTMRLIVKTKTNKKLSNYYDAVDVVEGYKGLHFLQFLTEAQTEYAYKKLSFDDIEYVEKDFYIELSNDKAINTVSEIASKNGHLSWNSATVQVDEAFDLINDSSICLNNVTVAVIDTGIYANHHRFLNSGRIVDSYYVFSQKEVNEYGENETVHYSSMDDSGYHGTHVAGIIFDNSLDNVYISPYKVTCGEQILYSDICFAVEDAYIFEGYNDIKIDVINISIAGGTIDPDYKLMYDTITDAIDSGVIVVVASGNFFMSTDNIYPACNKQAITVSSTNSSHKPLSNSCFGDAVDVSAPGMLIYSTVPPGIGDDPLSPTGSYYYDSGTSMAAPLVSAAAALIKSIDPDITPAEVERIIKETAYVPDDWEESCGGKNYGTGIVNFYNIAKAMLGEKSATPVISKTTDNKFEISLPDGIEGDIFYTLDGSEPTMVNGLLYSGPIDLSDKNINELKAVCHESGKVCGDITVKGLVMRKSLKLDYKETYMTMPYEYAYKGLWFDTDKNIADSNYKGEITGKSPGTSNVVFKLPNGERVIYTVTVDYALWQKIIIYFFFGFLWYI